MTGGKAGVNDFLVLVVVVAEDDREDNQASQDDDDGTAKDAIAQSPCSCDFAGGVFEFDGQTNSFC